MNLQEVKSVKHDLLTVYLYRESVLEECQVWQSVVCIISEPYYNPNNI